MSIGVYDRVVLCFRVFLFRTQRVAFSLPGLAFVQFRGVRMHDLNLNRKKSIKGNFFARARVDGRYSQLCRIYWCIRQSVHRKLSRRRSVGRLPRVEPGTQHLGPHMRIHIGDHCAQTGASRFGQAYHDHNVIVYNKRQDHEHEGHLHAMLHDDGSRGHDWLINEYKKMPGYEIIKYNRVHRRKTEQKVSILAAVAGGERRSSESMETETRRRAPLVRKNNQEGAFDHQQEMIGTLRASPTRR